MNFNILDKSTCTMMGAISRIQASLGGSGCCAGVGGPRSLGNFHWSCWWKTALELKVYIYISMDSMDKDGWSREAARKMVTPIAERRHPKIFVLEAQLPDDPLLQLWQGFVVILLRQRADVWDLSGGGQDWSDPTGVGFHHFLGCEPLLTSYHHVAKKWDHPGGDES